MTATVKCSGCGAEVPGGEVCRECGRLQRFPAGADHWAVLGFERRLVLDRSELERRFHALNRRFHPDYFRLRSPEEQAVSPHAAASSSTVSPAGERRMRVPSVGSSTNRNKPMPVPAVPRNGHTGGVKVVGGWL